MFRAVRDLSPSDDGSETETSTLPLSRASTFTDVTALSDEDGGDYQTGGSAPSAPPKRKRKREQIRSDFKQKLSSEESIRNMLAMPCRKNCRLHCFDNIHVHQLKKFRDEWVGLHKLDQDQIACRQQFIARLFVVCVLFEF